MEASWPGEFVGGMWTGQLWLDQRSSPKEFLQASKEHGRSGRSVPLVAHMRLEFDGISARDPGILMS